MIKLVVSDVDGTLLMSGKEQVEDKTLRAIEKLKNAGKNTAVASGRTYPSLEKLFYGVKDGLYFICCDGAVIVRDGKAVYTKQISSSDILSVIRYYDDCSVVLCTPMKSYALKGKKDISDLVEKQTGERPLLLERLYDLKEPVCKIAVFSDESKAKPMAFMPKTLRVSYSANGWCEYTSAIADKGLAVSELQARLYLSKFDTACIGDGQNDAGMMKKAAVAVSANRHHPSLDAVCNYHTDDASGFLERLCDE